MDLFIDCLITNTYESIGGLNVWEEIYAEYIGLRENKSTSYILSLIKDISYLHTKIFIINKCVEVLFYVYSRDLVLELKATGCKGKFDWSNKEQYNSDLKAAISYGKKYKIQALGKQKELDEYSDKHSGNALQRKDFELWAVILEEKFKINIDFSKITVARWCSYLNQYERWVEVINAQKNNLIKQDV